MKSRVIYAFSVLVLVISFFVVSFVFAQTTTVTPLPGGTRTLQPVQAEPAELTAIEAFPRQIPATPFIVTLGNLTPRTVAQTGSRTFVVSGQTGSYPAVVTVTQNIDGTVSTSTQQFPGLKGPDTEAVISDVSADGQLFVGYSESFASPSNLGEGTFWDVEGNPTAVDHIPPTTNIGTVRTVSEVGIGGGDNAGQAAVFSMLYGAVTIHTPESGFVSGISADGTLVGGSTSLGGTLWRAITPGLQYSAGTLVESPADAYVPYTIVHTISPDANWAAGGYYSYNIEDRVGLIWNSSGQILFNLGRGSVQDITNGGVAAFNAVPADAQEDAYLFIPGRGLVSLIKYCKEQGVSASAVNIGHFSTIYRLRRVEEGRTDGLLVVGRATAIGGNLGYSYFAYFKVEDYTTAASPSPSRIGTTRGRKP